MKNLIFHLAILIGSFSLPTFAQPLQLMVPAGHGEAPMQVSLSPDGKYAGSADAKSTILWEVETGRQLRVWVSRSLNAGVFFLPDGKGFVAPDASGRERQIYNLPTLEPRTDLFPDSAGEIVFSRDGQWCAYHTYKGEAFVAPMNNIRASISLKLKSGEQPNTDSSFMAVSPGFKFIALAGSRNVVDIWRFEANAPQRELLPLVSITGFPAGMRAGAFAPDEDRLVFSDKQKRLHCYSISQRKMLWTIPFDTSSVAFSTDGTKVLAASDKSGVFELDAATGATIRSLYKPQKWVYKLRLAAPNRLLVSGEENEALLLSYPQGEVLQRLRGRVDSTPDLLALPGKNQILVGQNDSPARLWDLDGGMMARTHNPMGSVPIGSLPANNVIVNKAGAFENLSLTDFSHKRLPGLEPLAKWTPFVVSPNGNNMLAWDSNGTVRLYDVGRGVAVKDFKPGVNEEIWEAAFSHDSQLFAVTLMERGEVKIYRTADAREVKTVALKVARGVSFMPDGRLVVDGDYRINVFDKNYQRQSSIPLPSRTYLSTFRWLPDGKRALIKVLSGESNLMLVDFEKNEIVRRYKGHSDFITSSALLPDGKHFVTSSSDNSTRLWNINAPAPLAQFYSFRNSNDWVVVTPDGRFDGSPGGIEQLYFVRGLETIALSAFHEKFYTPNLLPRLLQGEAPPTPNGVDDDIKKLKAPPIVKIILPGGMRNLTVENDVVTARRFTTTSDKITLTVEASAANDKVTELRLFHNGKLVGSGTRNLMVVDDTPAAQKSQTYEILLNPGDNHFRAVALNSQRTESRPDEVIITSKPPITNVTPTTSATLHMIVIGINQYKNPKYNLNYATADAMGFKAAVEAASVGLYTRVNAVYIGDANATRSGITAELEKVKQQAQPQDVFIFFYAGHGMMTEKNVFHLVPHDVTQMYGADEIMAQKGVSAALMQQYSREIKAQKQLFILDACQSAAALNNVVAARGVAEEKAIAQLARATGTHWLTATGSEQVASEFRQLGHGTFTYALLEALSGKADTGSDRKITVKEMDAYLQDVVPQLTVKYRGAPQYPASFGFGNDFPVGVVK